MLTKELIGLIGNASGLSKKETEQLLSTTTAVVRENLMAGNVIQLQGIGSLEVKERKERTIVHPQTGELTIAPTFEITRPHGTEPSKKQIAFKPVNNLKDTLKNI